MFHNLYVSLTLSLIVLGPVRAEPQQAPLNPTDLGVPFVRYTTKDVLDRTITFYVSVEPSENKKVRLPIVLFIQGSGCQPIFPRKGDGLSAGLPGLLLEQANGVVRVLVVEKPGVNLLDQPKRPGSAEEASEEFLTEHTLPRWTEANVAALRTTWTLPNVEPNLTLVMGHSEGGLVAARISTKLPQVTHVASLACGGPTQLFSLAELRALPRPDDVPGDAPKRRQAVYDEWARIQADPTSITRFWMGHPYRRWATFLPYSLTTELLRTKAKIYLAHGTNDKATPVTAFDVVRAELAVHKRDVKAERIEGANHSFRTKDMPQGSPDGFQALFGRVLAWFLI
jgi:pimeloyl-ACP methyl ester carboxylesterase